MPVHMHVCVCVCVCARASLLLHILSTPICIVHYVDTLAPTTHAVLLRITSPRNDKPQQHCGYGKVYSSHHANTGRSEHTYIYEWIGSKQCA